MVVSWLRALAPRPLVPSLMGRADWIKVRGSSEDGDAVYVCERCGERKAPTIPNDLDAFVAEMLSFQSAHADCKTDLQELVDAAVSRASLEKALAIERALAEHIATCCTSPVLAHFPDGTWRVCHAEDLR